MVVVVAVPVGVLLAELVACVVFFWLSLVSLLLVFV